MHQKRVTCELHDSYFRWMKIKHAIPKMAEVHIPMASYGKRSRRWAWLRIWDKVKISRCRPKVMHRKSDLWSAWKLFPLDDDQTCHSKDGGSAYSDGQLWEEITGAWRRVHISAWEFDGNIRLMNWTEDSEKIPLFTQACPVVHFLSHHLLTPKSPGLIDERF